MNDDAIQLNIDYTRRASIEVIDQLQGELKRLAETLGKTRRLVESEADDTTETENQIRHHVDQVVRLSSYFIAFNERRFGLATAKRSIE